MKEFGSGALRTPRTPGTIAAGQAAIIRVNTDPAARLQGRRSQKSPRQLFRQRAAARVHALGPRVAFELIDEIIRYHPDLEDEIDRRLDRYADLDPQVLRALGADRLPPQPIHAVRDSR
jgi:hypothetical protein